MQQNQISSLVHDSKDLEQFLKNGSNSLVRENLLRARLIYDLLLASANAGYCLVVYQPQVDKEGVDLVVEDSEMLRRLQLKTRCKTGATTWDVPKALLRPDITEQDNLGLESSPETSGFGGGILVSEYCVGTGPEIEVEYRYLDAYLLRLFALGAIRLSDSRASEEDYEGVERDLYCGSGKDMFQVKRNMTVVAKDTDALLNLMGLTPKKSNFWNANIINAFRDRASDREQCESIGAAAIQLETLCNNVRVVGSAKRGGDQGGLDK